jgi:hypothetical protein
MTTSGSCSCCSTSTMPMAPKLRTCEVIIKRTVMTCQKAVHCCAHLIVGCKYIM